MKHAIRLALVFSCCAPASALAQYVGSLEFSAGFGGEFESDPDKGDTFTFDAATGFSITPSIEQMLGKSVAIGAEWMFTWVKPDDDRVPDRDRQLIMSPHVRARMSFPIIPKVTFDGMLAIGPTIWTEPDGTDEGTNFGWSLRFNFGGSFLFNDSVAAFASLGYYTTTAYTDNATVNYNAIPLNVGLRGSF